MTKRPSQQGRFVHLDMVRGVAALLVCAEHLRRNSFVDYSNLDPKPSIPGKIFYLLTGQGHNAVVVFFVLSGFFVAGSVATDFKNKSWSWPQFAIRRLTRLYVVLVPALLLTLFWDEWGKQIDPARDFGVHSFSTFFGSVLFSQSIFTPFFGANPPLWSVAYEFWYYLMFPLLFAGLAFQIRKGERLLSLLLLVVCLGILPEKVLMGGVVWLMGYGAFELFRHKTCSRYVSSGAVLFFGAIGMALSAYMGISTHGFTGGDFTDISFRDLCTGLSFGLMVPFFAKNQPHAAWYRMVAVGLSDISYTLYAVHFPLVVFLSCTILQFKGAVPSGMSCAIFAGCLALILVYATVVWWLFESRTGKVRKFVEGKFLRSRAARTS